MPHHHHRPGGWPVIALGDRVETVHEVGIHVPMQPTPHLLKCDNVSPNRYYLQMGDGAGPDAVHHPQYSTQYGSNCRRFVTDHNDWH